MIQSIQTVDVTTYKNSIKAALTAAGKLGTVYYDSGSTMVFNIVGMSKVFKIAASDWFAGDAWTSAATITNQIALSEPYATIGSGDLSAMITGNGYVAIVLDQQVQNVNCHYTVVFTVDSTGKELALCYGISNSTSYNNSFCYDLSNNTQLLPGVRSIGTLLDPTGHYYSVEVVLKDSGNYKKVDNIPFVKSLCVSPTWSTTHVIYGDDVGVPAYMTGDGATVHSTTFLLIGGAL